MRRPNLASQALLNARTVVIALISVLSGQLAAQEQGSKPDAWNCAEIPARVLGAGKDAEATAAQTVTNRLRLELDRLGLLCPSLEPPGESDTVWIGEAEYKAYWERFRRSPSKLHFQYKLKVAVWEHADGLFDVILIGTSRVTRKNPSTGGLDGSNSEASVINWGRNYRSATLGEFASSSVDKIVNLFTVAVR
jgi:hypothetical protein